MLGLCHSINCTNEHAPHSDFCTECLSTHTRQDTPVVVHDIDESMAAKYPQYFKKVGEFTEIDVYAVHHLFDIKDPAGAIQHASKKLLLSGVRTGGKSAYEDIKEARDTLTRWMQLNRENQ